MVFLFKLEWSFIISIRFLIVIGVCIVICVITNYNWVKMTSSVFMFAALANPEILSKKSYWYF